MMEVHFPQKKLYLWQQHVRILTYLKYLTYYFIVYYLKISTYLEMLMYYLKV